MPPVASRLAIVGAWAPHRTEDAIARAARRMGLEARCFDALRRTRQLGPLAAPLLEHGIRRFDPDTILLTRHAHLLGEARLARLLAGRRSAFWYFDVAEHRGSTMLARLADATFVTSAGQVTAWRTRGAAQVHFLPQGLDPDRDRPARTVHDADRADVSFIGSGHYPHRWPLLEAVAAACTLRVYGPRWEGAPPTIPVAGGAVHGERFAEVVGASRVSLGANALPDQDRDPASASNRMWKILGCGGAYLGPHAPGLEAFATDGEHCRWYRSTEECVALVRAMLADPDATAAMAARGRAHALAHHTYDARLAMLLAGQGFPLPATTT